MRIRPHVRSFFFTASFLCGFVLCLLVSQLPSFGAATVLQSASNASPPDSSQDVSPLEASASSAATVAAAPRQQPEPLSPADAQALINDLSAAAFNKRQSAAQALRPHIDQPELLRVISAALHSETQPERIRRLVELLEESFRTADYRSAAAVLTAEMLEQAAMSEKWYLSEAAQDVLERLWRRRVEVAVLELRRLGVPLDPPDPQVLWKAAAAPQQFPPDPGGRQPLRIYIDEHWPAEPRAFSLLSRLKGLGVSSRLGGGLISIYRLEGHPLTVEQTALLKGIFGDFRVQDRGRVCLGITSESGAVSTGVLIGDVQPGSSAEKAGLKSGDFVSTLDGKPLTGFEEMVTLLRNYKVGDKVTLQVRSIGIEEMQMFRMRGGRIPPFPPGVPGLPGAPNPREIPKKGDPAPGGEPEKKPEDSSESVPDGPRDVEVVLQGWYDKSILLRPLDQPR